jgi:hypothetical protein
MSFARQLKANQTCRVNSYDVLKNDTSVLFETSEILLEAPNWHKDGYLILNGNGKLWKLIPGGELELIPITGLPDLNNDHVLAPDHKTIYMSAYEDWQIYKAPVVGGIAEQVSPGIPNYMYFLHGVSADETTLAYVNIDRSAENVFGSGRVHLLNLKTGEDTALVYGDGPEDGSEYSVDGEWIYFNTEHFSPNAQIARARLDGSDFEQLTFDDRVNWFPHQSLDGQYWVYLSYPPGTQGHPADLPVELCLVEGENWGNPKRLNGFPGGQGTINVNSWRPQSPVFAYVSYPFAQ